MLDLWDPRVIKYMYPMGYQTWFIFKNIGLKRKKMPFSQLLKYTSDFLPIVAVICML